VGDRVAYHKKGQRSYSKFQYHISENEVKYKVLMNPDKEKYAELREAVAANGGWCPEISDKTKENKCMCPEFLNKNKECWCAFKMYKKVLRTDQEKTQYMKNVEHDEAAEDKLLKKLEAEEKKKEVEEE
jgi:hypothetical protein